MKPKVLFACRVEDEAAKRRMEEYAEIVEIETADSRVLLDHVPTMTGLIVPYTNEKLITKEVLDKGVHLKLVGTTYGGTRQNVEDEYALEKGLTVIHTGGSRPRPMAEYTLGLVLSSLLQIHNYHHYMRSGEAWPRFKYGRTRILHRRKVGVIGCGLIGRGIIELFRNFTDEIYVRSNHLSAEQAEEMGVTKLELNEIFRECEIIILAGGYTPETHHMIGQEQFDQMQEEALFVNIARGKMVDEQAVIAAVNSKPIYLALDVFEEEPLPADSPLRQSDQVLLTPHRANNPREFEDRWQCLADELELFFTGKRPSSALTLNRARAMSSS